MKNLNPELIEKDLEKKHKKREKKHRSPMAVSGASVKELQRLIRDKAKVDKSK
jgi:hypothetical protein